MPDINMDTGFNNEQAILTCAEAILKEMNLNKLVSVVRIKQPPQGTSVDMNYLKVGGLLELEVVDTLENLEGRLRHELMHVKDQLDVSFGYREKKVPKAGTALLRRYKYLWNVYIDSRLAKAGKPAYATYDSREHEMGECWPELSAETRRELFDYLWDLSDTSTLSQKQIVQLSQDIFKFRKDLKAKAKARGEKVRKFKTQAELLHFAHWGDVRE